MTMFMFRHCFIAQCKSGHTMGRKTSHNANCYWRFNNISNR